MMWRGYPEAHESVLGHLRRVSVVKVDDSGAQQRVDLTGLASDAPKQIVRVQSHGFSSNPPKGSEGLLVSLGGRSDRAMVLGLEDPKTRQTGLPAGTSVLYEDKGNVVFVKGASGIQISAKTGDVTVSPAPGKFVFLGGDGTGKYDLVLTVSGPSKNVKAKLAG